MPLQCASLVDEYIWTPEKCTWKYYERWEAPNVVPNKKMLILGDSHLRLLQTSFLNYVCNVTIIDTHHPPYDGGDNGPCKGLILHYLVVPLCEMIPENITTYDLVIMNCGQHPAAHFHYTYERYRDSLINLVTSLTVAKVSTKKFFFMETIAQILRQDKFTIRCKDWRTLQRLHVFNHIAHEIIGDAGYPFISVHRELLPFIDKQCDIAHYYTENAYQPVIQQVFNILANM
jgi:hypothetical protein